MISLIFSQILLLTMFTPTIKRVYILFPTRFPLSIQQLRIRCQIYQMPNKSSHHIQNEGNYSLIQRFGRSFTSTMNTANSLKSLQLFPFSFRVIRHLPWFLCNDIADFAARCRIAHCQLPLYDYDEPIMTTVVT